MKPEHISRQQVYDIVGRAKASKKKKDSFVRQELQKLYPELISATVRVNGVVYNALDYLQQDIDSYG